MDKKSYADPRGKTKLLLLVGLLQLSLSIDIVSLLLQKHYWANVHLGITSKDDSKGR